MVPFMEETSHEHSELSPVRRGGYANYPQRGS